MIFLGVLISDQPSENAGGIECGWVLGQDGWGGR